MKPYQLTPREMKIIQKLPLQGKFQMFFPAIVETVIHCLN